MANKHILQGTLCRALAAAIVMHLALSTVLLGCEPPPPRTVSMRMRGGVPKATVTIDEMYIGSLAMVKQRGVALPPGKHRITVEAPGHFPWDKLVEVREGDAPLFLDVQLRRIPD